MTLTELTDALLDAIDGVLAEPLEDDEKDSETVVAVRKRKKLCVF